IDLKRAGYFVKEYVYRIEEAVIRTLLHFDVTGHRVAGAPGIYVRLDDPAGHALLPQRPMKGAADPNFSGLGKIAALGIKVTRNCTYHGVALNVAMDLEPYSRINPCGYAGLQTVWRKCSHKNLPSPSTLDTVIAPAVKPSMTA
ncbi:MAG: hypothetical protein RLZZ371_1452, partial [Pseudomonadota bacterium]